jgi:catechol 2,3-dioxygenase-like lactoylglutathione lyase family enzyme
MMIEHVKVMAQVAIVVRDIEEKSKAYAAFFGVDVPGYSLTAELEDANTRFLGEQTEARAKLAFFQLDNIQVELIEPVGGPSTWQNFLDTKGEGIHHIAFHVPDMDEEVARLEGLGMTLQQSGDFTGGCYAYIDGNTQLGGILELLASK